MYFVSVLRNSDCHNKGATQTGVGFKNCIRQFRIRIADGEIRDQISVSDYHGLTYKFRDVNDCL